MKTLKNKLFVIVCVLVLSFGCDTSVELSDLYPNLDLEDICYSIHILNSHQPIQGATLTLIDYNEPNCKTCPVDFKLISDADGEACATVFEGWTCESAILSAEGYITLTITGKPPITIYLTPL